MTTTVVVKKNTYFDSVSLMSISTKANELDGVEQAFVASGTVMNKEVLRSLGQLSAELEDACPGDLMIVVETSAGTDPQDTLTAVEELFTRKKPASHNQETTYRSIDAAVQHVPGANLAVIAVNGAFAVREARAALQSGLHVMLFSDHVSVQDEVALKTLAHEQGLLMMGPDCGTAIINNVALCFGNAVRPGCIGVVAASGTGSQEVSVQIHGLGGGISQLIGTGGRDMSERVGGIMMLDGIRALEQDRQTSVIVLVSKPPARTVEAKILAEISHCSKPVVVCFIGGSQEAVADAGGTFARDTRQAALAAMRLSGLADQSPDLDALDWPMIETIRAKFTAEARYIRGLFCGGTICDEVMYAVAERYPDVYSNIASAPDRRPNPTSLSMAHTFLDFGDDAFTSGRPHPMIDPSQRIARFTQEAKDPEVAVIVLDFILGYGSHQDPVGVMLPAIVEAKHLARDEGRHLEILGYVLGTELDHPDMGEQIAKLESAGVTVSRSSAGTGLLARELVWKGQNS